MTDKRIAIIGVAVQREFWGGKCGSSWTQWLPETDEKLRRSATCRASTVGSVVPRTPRRAWRNGAATIANTVPSFGSILDICFEHLRRFMRVESSIAEFDQPPFSSTKVHLGTKQAFSKSATSKRARFFMPRAVGSRFPMSLYRSTSNGTCRHCPVMRDRPSNFREHQPEMSTQLFSSCSHWQAEQQTRHAAFSQIADRRRWRNRNSKNHPC